MTATSATAVQYGQAAGRPAGGGRHGVRSDGDPGEFGKIMSSSGGADQARVDGSNGAGGDRRDTRIDDSDKATGSDEADADALTGSKSDVDEHRRDGADSDVPSSERDESRKATLAILPLLTAELRDAERRIVKGAGHAATSAQTAAGRDTSSTTATQAGNAASVDVEPAGRLEALVRQVVSTGAGEAPHALFGKALQANLGAMPTEKLARAGTGDGEIKKGVVGKDAGEPPRLARETLTAGVEQRASAESRTELRMAPELRGDRNEARTAEGRSQAGMDKPALPNGVTAALPTGGPIVQAAASAPGWAAALQRPASVMPGTAGSAAPVEALKIQLHPAELGMVTANLRIADGQLSIEIDVDTPEAYLKLSSERDAISKALRSTGMTVDNVTINPPPTHQPAAARDPGGVYGGGQNSARQDFQGSGTFGQPASNGNAGRGTSGDSRHRHDHIAPTETRPDGAPSGGRVYI